MKVDLMKAYDSLNWKFIIVMPNCMEFSTLFMRWIESYITTPFFSVCINSKIQGFFSRVLGVLDKKIQSLHTFLFQPWKFSLVLLVSLCFTNDLILFYKVDANSVKLIKNILEAFHNWSSLKANPSKSNILSFQ